jgi:hypothetical protein
MKEQNRRSFTFCGVEIDVDAVTRIENFDWLNDTNMTSIAKYYISNRTLTEKKVRQGLIFVIIVVVRVSISFRYWCYS